MTAAASAAGSKDGPTGMPPPIYRSMFGPQPYSHRPSAPVYSFTMAHIEERAAQYLGKQFCHEHMLKFSPGPDAYSPRLPPKTVQHPAMAKDKLERTIGADTLPYAYLGAPGPGQYIRDSNMNLVGASHALASRQSPLRAGWSAYSQRESQAHVYLGSEFEREALGVESPGPCTAVPEAYSSVGRQISSRKRTSIRCSIPRSDRFLRRSTHTEPWPDPGQYDY